MRGSGSLLKFSKLMQWVYDILDFIRIRSQNTESDCNFTKISKRAGASMTSLSSPL